MAQGQVVCKCNGKKPASRSNRIVLQRACLNEWIQWPPPTLRIICFKMLLKPLPCCCLLCLQVGIVLISVLKNSSRKWSFYPLSLHHHSTRSWLIFFKVYGFKVRGGSFKEDRRSKLFKL